LSRGIVCTYIKLRGIGFIRQKSGREIFFRRSSIHINCRWSLGPGDRVEFEVVDAENGLQAKNIKKI
jgi:cold shock CspA family protein